MKLPFNLCQPGTASCGACCGLYSFKGHQRELLRGQLARRSAIFTPLERSRTAFADAARTLRREEGSDQQRLDEASPLCALLGFVDAAQTRIGCLGHARVTGGVDLRDCGTYSSATTCEEFSCPAVDAISPGEAELVRDACADWYLYGLVITDVPFVRGCLKLIVAARGGPVPLERLRSPAALSALRSLFALKEELPGRPAAPGVLGRAPPAPHGPFASPEDELFPALGCQDATREVQQAARQLIRERVRAVAGGVS